jgi:membrane protease YdiL (CAAX protease family)
VILFIPATLVGWGCGALLEGLPLRALGWALHRGWVRDLLVGSLVGAASLVLAGAIAAAPGGFHFTLTGAGMWPVVAKTLFSSALIFICAGAAEEVLFRGYPLQTVLRSWPAWAALIPTSVAFAAIHLDNPNTVRGFTFINTALAGVWLGVAYLRTRSLWFPLGIHWAWNWTMGAVLGLPVSGISKITPAPLMRAVDQGPAWLTGGSYGIEGGAACTLVLLISTAFIWRTRLVSATEEMKRLTDKENPAPPRQSLTAISPPSDQPPPSP